MCTSVAPSNSIFNRNISTSGVVSGVFDVGHGVRLRLKVTPNYPLDTPLGSPSDTLSGLSVQAASLSLEIVGIVQVDYFRCLGI